MHLTIAYWDWLFWCILIMFATLSYSHSIAQNKLYNDKIMNHSFNFQSMQSSLLSGWGTLLNHWDILPVGVMLDDCHNVSYICTGHICMAYQNSRYYLTIGPAYDWVKIPISVNRSAHFGQLIVNEINMEETKIS